MVEDRNLNQFGFETVESVHLMTEVERLAYADRAKYLGDVDFFKVPVKTLISYPYVKERMKNFNKDSAGKSEIIKAGQIQKVKKRPISIPMTKKVIVFRSRPR